MDRALVGGRMVDPGLDPGVCKCPTPQGYSREAAFLMPIQNRELQKNVWASSEPASYFASVDTALDALV